MVCMIVINFNYCQKKGNVKDHGISESIARSYGKALKVNFELLLLQQYNSISRLE